MASLNLFHGEELERPSVVYEVISMGERIGNGCLLVGSIAESPSGVLSTVSSSSTSIVPGLSWPEWQVSNQ